MNHLTYNFKGKNDIQKCICGVIMNNVHLYQCTSLREGRKCDISYIKIFNGSLMEQQQIVNILHENMKSFEEFPGPV